MHWVQLGVGLSEKRFFLTDYDLKVDEFSFACVRLHWFQLGVGLSEKSFFLPDNYLKLDELLFCLCLIALVSTGCVFSLIDCLSIDESLSCLFFIALVSSQCVFSERRVFFPV